MLGTDFYFNGAMSTDLGVYLVKLSTNFTSSPFLSDKEIVEEDVAGASKPYFFGVKRKPLTFKLVLSCLEGQWTPEKRMELANWLDTDGYELFYSTDDVSKWYYCQYTGGIDLSMNYVQQGYIEVTMRCDSRHTYSPFYDKEYDFSQSTEPVVIDFPNTGSLDLFPEMWITKVGDDNGDISIVNQTDGNREFKFMTSTRARGKLNFLGATVKDGEVVKIGKDTYEFDTNGVVAAGNIRVDVVSPASPVDTVLPEELQSTIEVNSLYSPVDYAINQLVSVISSSHTENVTAVADFANLSVNVTFGSLGTIGNIPVSTTCQYGVWETNTLVGVDGLVDGEIVYIDNQYQHIETNQVDLYRFSAFNDKYLYLKKGINKLAITGKCLIRFRWQFETLG